MRFLFFGTSEFAKIILEQLIQNGYIPELVVSQPSKPQGRKHSLKTTPVLVTAEKTKLKTITPNDLNDENFKNQIILFKPDFIIVTAYGKIIPKWLIELPPKGVLGLHPSLLPALRGASPIQSAILNDYKETGVTLFLMDELMDHGPIIKQMKVEIPPRINSLELSHRLANAGAQLLIETLPLWLNGEIIPQAQDENKVTSCSKITPQDEKINWQKTNNKIDRQVRALFPSPEAYTILDNQVIKILSGEPCEDNEVSLKKQIGEIFVWNKKLAVKCGIGFYVVNELRPAGKKTMLSKDFLAGHKTIVGKIFEF